MGSLAKKTLHDGLQEMISNCFSLDQLNSVAKPTCTQTQKCFAFFTFSGPLALRPINVLGDTLNRAEVHDACTFIVQCEEFEERPCQVKTANMTIQFSQFSY